MSNDTPPKTKVVPRIAGGMLAPVKIRKRQHILYRPFGEMFAPIPKKACMYVCGRTVRSAKHVYVSVIAQLS